MAEIDKSLPNEVQEETVLQISGDELEQAVTEELKKEQQLDQVPPRMEETEDGGVEISFDPETVSM